MWPHPYRLTIQSHQRQKNKTSEYKESNSKEPVRITPCLAVGVGLLLTVVLVLLVLGVLVPVLGHSGDMARRQSLEEQLRCPVCLDVFSEPLMLQCGHSYCKYDG